RSGWRAGQLLRAGRAFASRDEAHRTHRGSLRRAVAGDCAVPASDGGAARKADCSRAAEAGREPGCGRSAVGGGHRLMLAGESAATSDAAATLESLRNRGIVVWADGGQLRYRAPGGALAEDDVERLRASKAQILALLSGRGDPAAREPAL